MEVSSSLDWPLLKQASQMLGMARKGLGLDDFPFESRLNMKPLVDYWSTYAQQSDAPNMLLAERINEYVEEHPSLLEPYDDLKDFLQDHHKILDVLFGGVFPPILSEKLLGYASAPFMMTPFYATKSMHALLSDPNSTIVFEQYGEFHKIPYSIRACFIILEKHYGIDVEHVLPFLFSLKFEDSTMELFYKTTSMLDFLQVKTKGVAPQLSRQQVNYLLQNARDVDLWLKVLSPEVFYFEGIYLAFMNDVTEMESLSRLRKILLAPGALLDMETAKTIANLTRTYLQLKDVEVGIAALDYPSERSVAHRYKIKYPIIENVDRFLGFANKDSVYERACQLNHTQIVSDLKEISHPAPIEQALLDAGYRSLMVVPLRDQETNIIGIMELASPDPFAFTYIKNLKLKEILPLYDIALEESRKSVENRIQSVIQDQFTNIHPCVLWRFNETAFDYLEEKEKKGDRAILKPIIFKGVYPLFGQIDIISSTEIRNQAVRVDIEKNLELLHNLLEDAYKVFGYPILKKHSFQIQKNLDLVRSEFTNSLETTVADLLLHDIHPLLRELAEKRPDIQKKVQTYFDNLDGKLEIVYEARKHYQESIDDVNRTIANYLDRQERINQQVIPHYFEMYKTDGVDYSIYVGQSLLQHDSFNMHHLQNLRLWQIKSMLETHQLLKKIQPTLAIDLPVSYLIFVYGSSLSIRFRLEEKHFDVEGAYHLQYEVIKTRVDKAMVARRNERLRKKDTLSIVYLQEKDRDEYLEYLGYLINEGLLQDKIEEVQLEHVQGVQGLRALRVDLRNSPS